MTTATATADTDLDFAFYIDILSRAYDALAGVELSKEFMSKARSPNGNLRWCWPWSTGIYALDGLGALTQALLDTKSPSATATATASPLVPHEYCRVEGYLLGVLRDAIEISLGRNLGADYGAPYDLPVNDAAALSAFCDIRWVREPHVLTLFEIAIAKLTNERRRIGC